MKINIFQRLAYSPFSVTLVIIRRCNLACGYCNEYDNSSEPVPFIILKRRIDLLKKLGNFSLVLSGGEPFLHPQIIDLIKYSKKRFFRVGVITNSYLLDEKKIKELNKSGLTDMQISIDGVIPNSISKKVLKPLRKKLEMIAENAKFNINLNSVIGATSPNEVIEVMQFAKSKGFYSTILFVHDKFGQIKLNKEKRLVYEKAKNLRNPPFWDRYMNFTEDLIYKGSSPFKCRAGSRYLYIDELGNVNWCSQTRKRFSKPLDEYGFRDLKNQFYKKKGCEDKCTLGCVRRASFIDSFRAYG